MRKSYEGASIAISFDPEICQHSGECVRGLPAVFDAKRRPWIDPGGADPETVAAQVRCCPSGALQFELRDPAGPVSAG
jgi:uncharacterized Fe-S cluster protein YjdI